MVIIDTSYNHAILKTGSFYIHYTGRRGNMSTLEVEAGIREQRGDPSEEIGVLFLLLFDERMEHETKLLAIDDINREARENPVEFREAKMEFLAALNELAKTHQIKLELIWKIADNDIRAALLSLRQ